MGVVMKGDNIADRLLAFAADVLVVADKLPKNATGRHVMTQLVRAASGGGSNYEEARAAESRADFVHKVAIAAKEAREALYWLRLIDRAKLCEVSVAALVGEANELVAILTSSVRTAKGIGHAPVVGGRSGRGVRQHGAGSDVNATNGSGHGY